MPVVASWDLKVEINAGSEAIQQAGTLHLKDDGTLILASESQYLEVSSKDLGLEVDLDKSLDKNDVNNLLKSADEDALLDAVIDGTFKTKPVPYEGDITKVLNGVAVEAKLTPLDALKQKLGSDLDRPTEKMLDGINETNPTALENIGKRFEKNGDLRQSVTGAAKKHPEIANQAKTWENQLDGVNISSHQSAADALAAQQTHTDNVAAEQAVLQEQIDADTTTRGVASEADLAQQREALAALPGQKLDALTEVGVTISPEAREALLEINQKIPETVDNVLGQIEKGQTSIGDALKNAIEEGASGASAADLAAVQKLETAVTDGVELLQDLTQMSKLAGGLRLATSAPAVLGATIAVASTGANASVHDAQRDSATSSLSAEAAAAYNDLNVRHEWIAHTQTAIDMADPSIVVGLGITTLAELYKREEYNTFIEDSGLHDLSNEEYQGLSTSAFVGNSPRTDFLLEADIPETIEGVPEELQTIIELNNKIKEIDKTISDRLAEANDQLPMEAVRMKEEFVTEYNNSLLPAREYVQDMMVKEIDDLVENPETAGAYLNLIPVEERLAYVRTLEASENDADAFAQEHPEVAAYTEEYNESWTGLHAFMENDDTLRANPDSVNAYISSRFSPKDGQSLNQTTVQLATTESETNMNHQNSLYAGNEDLLQEAQAAGINVDPAMLNQQDVTQTAFKPAEQTLG